MAEVRLVGLTKRYGDTPVVDRVNLIIQSGELAALLGPSGCGKTTTLRMIAGLQKPSCGDILFDGRSMLRIPPEKRGAVMVFQKHLLFPHMNVADNVGFGLRMRGVDRRTVRVRSEAMLELVQLPGYGDRRPDQLSGGQQQRVALARALVVEPQVLLLDEPLANLDANLRVEMRKLIRTIQQEMGITTIFVTHDQEEAVMLADRVALMMDGRVQQVGTPRDLYERPRSVRVARFFRNENLLSGTKAGVHVTTAAGTLALACDGGLDDGPVFVTVRPEHVALACSRQCANTVSATVVDSAYMGAFNRVQAMIGDELWTLHLPSDISVRPGQRVDLHLPCEHVWTMPAP